MTRRVWVAFAFVLFVPTAVGQAPVLSDFSSSGSTTFQGDSDLRWEAAVVSVRPEGHPVDVAVDAEPGVLRIINRPYHRLAYEDPQGGGPRSIEWLGVEDTVFEAAVAGRLDLTLDPTRAGEARLVREDERIPLRTGGDSIHVEPVGTELHTADETPFSFTNTYGGVYINPRARYTQAAVDLEALDLEDVVLAATGGTLTLPDGTTRTLGTQMNRTLSVYDPDTGYGHYVHDNLVLVLPAPRIHVSAPDATWFVGARALEGTVGGAASWRGLRGVVDVAEDRSEDPSLLEVEGRFEVRAHLDESPASWRVQGTASRVLVDTQPIFSAATGVVGAGVLAALAALLVAGKGLATFLLGKATPRVALAGALENRNRRRVLALLLEHQPVRLSELQEHTRLSRSALRYHLRILEASGLVRSHAVGRRNRTFLVPSSGGRADMAALSVANSHPLRHALYQYIASHGTATVADLQAAVVRDGVAASLPASTAAFHLKQLVDAGLVEGRWQGGRKHYQVPQGWEAPSSRLRVRLGDESSLVVLGLVHRNGPLMQDELVAATAAAGLRPAAVRRRIRRLCDLRLLTSGPDGTLQVRGPLSGLVGRLVPENIA